MKKLTGYPRCKNQGTVFILFILSSRCIRISMQQFHFTSTNDGQDHGYYLSGSVYKTLLGETFSFCWLNCFEDDMCSSLNFDMTTGKCEFNKHTKDIELPSNFGKRGNSIHFSKPPPDECINYTNLTEANRNIRNNMAGRSCDSHLVTGKWYRIAGEAGTRLLDSCPVKTCHADFRYWLNGAQPKIGELKVERQICTQGNGKCCLWPRSTLASNCGTFIVYRLIKAGGCSIRYCGQD